MLVVLGGCSIHPFRTVTVKGHDLASSPDIAIIDPNDTEASPYKITITPTEDGGTFYEWSADMAIAQDEPLRLKYHWLHSLFPNLKVSGTLDGKKYP